MHFFQIALKIQHKIDWKYRISIWSTTNCKKEKSKTKEKSAEIGNIEDDHKIFSFNSDKISKTKQKGNLSSKFEEQTLQRNESCSKFLISVDFESIWPKTDIRFLPAIWYLCRKKGEIDAQITATFSSSADYWSVTKTAYVIEKRLWNRRECCGIH